MVSWLDKDETNFLFFSSSAGHEVKLTHNTGKSGDLSPSMHQLMDQLMDRLLRAHPKGHPI